MLAQSTPEPPTRCQRFSISLWLASWLTHVAAHFSIHHGGRSKRTFISHRIHNLAPMPIPRPSPLFGPALEQVAHRGVRPGRGVWLVGILRAVMGPVRFLAPPCPFPSHRKWGWQQAADQTKRYALLILSHPPHLLRGLLASLLNICNRARLDGVLDPCLACTRART
ncbi:hypothetical protein LX36DRAFT_350160 [Colletotrichum falcatum]|nr:hypothetical protein LX36DRAFT_350160 [Colletotrichum falcatum]